MATSKRRELALVIAAVLKTIIPPHVTGSALSLGRWFFGIAAAGSGVLQLVTGEFVRLTKQGAGQSSSLGPYLTGIVLFAAGCAIATGRLTRLAASVIAGLILVSLVAYQMPQVIDNPWVGHMWTNPLKAVALVGGAGLVAARSWPHGGAGAVPPTLGRVERFAVLALAVFLFVCGVQHFVYADFVSTLVPSWMPNQSFWTYFTGAALIAGGVGILVPRTALLAAALCAAMIFLWVLLLHIPRALSGPNRANEAAGLFEALAISGIALMIAAARSRRERT